MLFILRYKSNYIDSDLYIIIILAPYVFASYSALATFQLIYRTNVILYQKIDLLFFRNSYDQVVGRLFTALDNDEVFNRNNPKYKKSIFLDLKISKLDYLMQKVNSRSHIHSIYTIYSLFKKPYIRRRIFEMH